MGVVLTYAFYLVKSFVEFIEYIFTLPEVTHHKLSFLSQNLCQDPLECFFGCQMQTGQYKR